MLSTVSLSKFSLEYQASAKVAQSVSKVLSGKSSFQIVGDENTFIFNEVWPERA